MSDAVKSDRGGENTSPKTYVGTASTDEELAKQSSGSFPEASTAEVPCIMQGVRAGDGSRSQDLISHGPHTPC